MKPIQVEDIVNYKFLSEPAIGPRGVRAAFVVRTPDVEANTYHADLWTIDLKSGITTRLTSSGKDGAFAWKADGSGIFFLSGRAGKTDVNGIYEIAIDGGEASLVAELAHKAETLALGPQGTLMYTARIPLDGPPEEEDAADYEVLEEIPYWMNGKGFTSRKRAHLFQLDPASGKAVDLSLEDPDLEVETFDIRGARVALIGRRFEGMAPTVRELWILDTKNGTRARLVDVEMSLDAVRFASDGELVLLGSDMRTYGIGQNREIHRVRLSDGAMETLTPGWDRSVGNSIVADCRHGGGQTLQVDGERVLVSTTDRTHGVLLALSRSGEISELLRSSGAIDAYAVRDETVVSVELLAHRLQEITVYRNGQPTASTHFNSAALQDRPISKPEPFSASADAGPEIDAWLIRPLDCDPQTKVPTVLTIHGGPRAAYSDVFFHQMQAMAAQGYAIVICNPRGSSGRGNEFADIRAKYGTIDYDDLMAVLDAALAKYPFLDAERLGVMGGSYGGFMTNWIIGHTNRFRAAVTQRSIANWISKFNTTDIGYYFNEDQMGADPWSEGGADKLWWHSPVKYADQATTPTLIIHSEEDYRCWLTEGLQMFTALKYHGVESRMLIVRGENHELSRSGKPKHRLRRLQEIVSWFDKHLKGESEVA